VISQKATPSGGPSMLQHDAGISRLGRRHRWWSAAQQRARTLAVQAVFVGVVVLLWWYYSREGRVSPILLPKVEKVWDIFPDIVTQERTYDALWLTLREILGAAAVSAGIGLTVGMCAGRTRYGTRLVEPLLVWMQTIPIILLYPVCVLIFGLGVESKIAFAGIYGLFPVALNTTRGLNTVDQRYCQAAASMGASRWQLLWRVQLPAARPMILSGLRLGAALNLTGVLAGEILASIGGLGFLISQAAATFQIAELYAYIIIALVLVLCFNAVVTRAEERQVVK
jgi:ABC-type nitrate/sulfonate/bicarbonate transport system, permease component